MTAAEDVRGRVVGLEGLPIGRAEVVLWESVGREVLRLGRATTDSSGRFRVSEFVVPMGRGPAPAGVGTRWTVTVQAPGWMSGEHREFDPAVGAALIRLAPETSPRVVFGRVLFGATDPVGIPGSHVVVLDGLGQPVVRLSTDADGRFVLRGAVLGRGDLRAVAHHGDYGLSRFVAVPEVGRGETARLEFTLERTLASLRSVVHSESGEPVVGREFLLRRVSRSDPGSAADGRVSAVVLFPEIPVRTGIDGSILVRGLEPADYDLCLADTPEIRTHVRAGSPVRIWRLPSTDP